MRNFIFLVGAFVFFLFIEFVMMEAHQASPSTRGKKILIFFSRAILLFLILAYLLLVCASLFIGINLLLNGKTKDGVSVLLFSIIIAVCVYFWLIKGFIDRIKQGKK